MDVQARVLSLGRSAAFGSIAVFVVAFLLRLVPVLVRSGLLFLDRYDDGVYYASADALTFGWVPYADFVLLHPPGITLALVPFAVLGRLTTDTAGFEAARVAFMALGALNAVLVFHIGRRWGAAVGLIAGLGYAALWPAAYSERTMTLETLGGTAVLAAVLLLVRHRPERSGWRLVAVGALLGAACCVKLWYLVPAAVMAGWVALAWSRRSAGGRLARMLGGGAAAVLVIAGPLALLAHESMWRMVVLDQVRRTGSSVALWPRVPVILGSGRSMALGVDAFGVVVTVIVAVVVIVAAAACLVEPSTRPLVVWLTVGVAVVLATPVFYTHYAVFVSAPEALVVAIGVTRLARTRSLGRAVVAGGLAVVVILSAAYTAVGPIGGRFPGPELADGAPEGCVTSDSPALLAMMDRLSADLRQGCPMPVDIGGLYLDMRQPRHGEYQARLLDYLSSGAAFVLAPQTFANETPQTRRTLESRPVLAEVDDFVLRAGDASAP